MLQRLLAFLLAAVASVSYAQTQPVSLDHVAIYVKDVQVSASFYKNVFGLAELPVRFGAPVPVKWMDLGHGIALHIVGGQTEPQKRSKWDHIALACGNMDAEIARLDANGIPWASMDGKKSPQVRPDEVKQIFVQDPDGYWIEINDLSK